MDIDMTKVRCQSCGMPLGDGMFGTNADGSFSDEYCKMCFQNGVFVEPSLTLDQMIQKSVDYMTSQLNIPEPEAREATTKALSSLKRWQ